MYLLLFDFLIVFGHVRGGEEVEKGFAVLDFGDGFRVFGGALFGLLLHDLLR